MGVHLKHINRKESVFRKNKTHSQKIFFKKKINDRKKMTLYKDLSILLNAGIDLKESLSIIKNQQKKNSNESLYDNILNNIIKGKPFYQALNYTNEFSDYEIYSIKIGEETHMLEKILDELHIYVEKRVKLKKQIISLLAYPAFILLLTLGTLYFMLTYVVPLFETVFNQFNQELPELTKFIIHLSENFNFLLFIFLSSVLSIYLLYTVIKNNIIFRKISSQIVLKIPFLGKLIKEIYMARFCQSMSLLLTSKTSIIESLELVIKMINYYPLEIALKDVKSQIEKGNTFGEAIKKFSIFDSNVISMIKIAEEVNQLDSMFVRLALNFNEEVTHKTTLVGKIIEPVLILFIGCIVGLIMISMYAPMFDLSKVIGN
ncbi:type IV pilus assembly protein PilC [Mesonia phycicola]|uniref:Type IV pilus assembly protein PilC n=1 Tax=Mesonia phycicola TaxID=579105 RepID=A0A1M6DKV6_9FLAO|nr:type II secretion system F family protein [Mesonia phycicola]SHI73845.1 type IV pilus assembly protein PilC [Mesonia phycicola]